MQSTLLEEYGVQPFFPVVLANESTPKDKVHFLKTIKKSASEETKVFFTSSKIFLVHIKDKAQQRVEVRLRTPLTSLIGESSRLMGVQ